jgi:hypothetical protein
MRQSKRGKCPGNTKEGGFVKSPGLYLDSLDGTRKSSAQNDEKKLQNKLEFVTLPFFSIVAPFKNDFETSSSHSSKQSISPTKMQLRHGGK